MMQEKIQGVAKFRVFHANIKMIKLYILLLYNLTKVPTVLKICTNAIEELLIVPKKAF